MRYFSKASQNVPFYRSNGTKLVFIPSSISNIGILETEDGSLADEILQAIAKGVGGMSEITKEEFDSRDVKKKTSTDSDSLSNKQFLDLSRNHPTPLRPQGESVAAANPTVMSASVSPPVTPSPSRPPGKQGSPLQESSSEGYRPSPGKRQ